MSLLQLVVVRAAQVALGMGWRVPAAQLHLLDVGLGLVHVLEIDPADRHLEAQADTQFTPRVAFKEDQLAVEVPDV